MTTPVHTKLVEQQTNVADISTRNGIVTQHWQRAKTVIESPIVFAVYHSVWYFELAGLLGQLQGKRLNRFNPGAA